ncbi:hypothetical protein D3C78_1769780 [compost metagenome]
MPPKPRITCFSAAKLTITSLAAETLAGPGKVKNNGSAVTMARNRQTDFLNREIINLQLLLNE